MQPPRTRGDYSEKGSDMKDGTRRLRPMGIADILDETVELYKTSFVLLVGIAAVLYVPYSIFSQYFMTKYYPRLDQQTNPLDLLPMIGAAVLGGLWVMLVSPFVTGAMTYAISERYLSRQATVGTSFKRVLSWAVFWRLAGAAVANFAVMLAMIGISAGVIGLCVLVGHWRTEALFAAVPLTVILVIGAVFGGCYVLLRLVLLNCTIIVEMRPFIDSIVRAWKLVGGSMLKCLGLLALASIVVSIVSSIVVQPTQTLLTMGMMKGGPPAEWLLILHTLIGATSSTVLAPVTSIVTILLYYDIRIRKEGFDLELLASELHAKSRQASGWTPQPLPQEQTVQLPQEQVAPVQPEQPSPEEGPTAQ